MYLWLKLCDDLRILGSFETFHDLVTYCWRFYASWLSKLVESLTLLSRESQKEQVVGVFLNTENLLDIYAWLSWLILRGIPINPK